MPMIRETIVTTLGAEGRVHLAPLGIIDDGEGFILAPHSIIWFCGDFEIAVVPVRLDQVASFIVNANHGIRISVPH